MSGSSRRERPRTPTSAPPAAAAWEVGSGAHEAAHLDLLLRDVPDGIDVDRIRDEWRAARGYRPLEARGLPDPPWSRRGYEHEGQSAWEVLRGLEPGRRGPMAAYVHVPFCDVRCPFCDCYSVASPRARRSPREAAFVAALLDDIAAWGALPCVRDRPVTTIHFGGGTPNHLEERDLDRILCALRDTLGTHAKTEWALESTSRILGRRHLEWLLERGFRRLHVGVQTLENPVRRVIGRHGDAELPLERLGSALSLGVTVTVDLVYGLPGQTVAGWVETLRRLVAVGVHGISLYQLQVSDRNLPFLIGHGVADRDILGEYVLFQCAEQELLRAGFSKNHFTHFARGPDQNLYYRHPTRGEDLLALGPTASGVFDRYYYRHAELDAYLEQRGSKGLEGALRESPAEGRVGPAAIELMSGGVCRATLAAFGTEALLDRWLSCDLVRQTEPPGQFALTASGSWFLKAMLEELEAAPPDAPADMPESRPS